MSHRFPIEVLSHQLKGWGIYIVETFDMKHVFTYCVNMWVFDHGFLNTFEATLNANKRNRTSHPQIFSLVLYR